MKPLVCGGRDFNRYTIIYDALDSLAEERGPVTEVIVGGARGADHWGEAWAYHNHIPFRVFKADWKRDGKAAGPIRNQRMLDDGKPDLVVAFPGGRGTTDMVRRACEADIEVIQIEI